jgi:2-oxo-4-hydroxy-4-carboxy-5-ureidoimidazoline decarboxylase
MPVSLQQLNSASSDDFITVLVTIFEHSPCVPAAVAAQRPFVSLASLCSAMSAAVQSASPVKRLELINRHPDLAGRAARASTMTAESKSEQGSAGLDRLSDAQYDLFHGLNEAYRQKFGIPFVICVRRHTKDSILRQFELRLKHTAEVEYETAINEILRISALRLDQHVVAPDRLPVSGQLTTHVLNNHDGRPAEGIALTLFELGGEGARRVIIEAVTNHEGRTEIPLISARPLPIGRYELRFEIGRYYAEQGTPTADPPFLQSVPIEFSIAEPEGHYHVPLLVTPWSFATYRGS